MAKPAFQSESVGATADVLTFERPILIDYDEVQATGADLFAYQEAHKDRNLVLVFTGVQGISSAMLGKLITLNRRVGRSERKVVLCSLEREVAEMFTSSRLDDYFKITPDRDSALAWLESSED